MDVVNYTPLSLQSRQQLQNLKGNAMLTAGITQENLNDIYSDPYILKVGHDSRSPSPVVHPLATYLTVTVSGVFAGAYLLIRHTAIEFEIHSLLKHKFIRYSRQLVQIAFAWAFSHQGVERVTAHVSSDMQTVKNYCLKVGFKLEGIRRNACMKSGKLYDVYMFGILRSDWSKSWGL